MDKITIVDENRNTLGVLDIERSDEELLKILEEVRKKRKERKKKVGTDDRENRGAGE